MIRRPWPFRYAFATFLTLAAFFGRLSLRNIVRDDIPSEAFLLVLIVVALYAGIGPAVLSLVAGGILMQYFFMGPHNSFAVHDIGDLIGLGLYYAIGCFIILIGDMSRKAHYQVTREKESLQKMAVQLAESEERFRSFAENSSEMFIILRRDRSIEYVNRGFQTLTGRPAADLYANPNLLLELTVPEDRELVLKHLTTQFQEGKNSDIEFRCFHSDGGIKWVHVRSDVIYDSDGLPFKSIALSHDITERKLHQAERDQLLADLQDSINNVKLLSGLIPICAGCKKVRDDRGYWQQVEKYVRDHSEAEFTHALCPDCLVKYGWTDKAPLSSNAVKPTI